MEFPDNPSQCVLHNYCEINNFDCLSGLFKKQIKKHKEDRLINANQDAVFSMNLDEGEIIRDVLQSSVKSAIDNTM